MVAAAQGAGKSGSALAYFSHSCRPTEISFPAPTDGVINFIP